MKEYLVIFAMLPAIAGLLLWGVVLVIIQHRLDHHNPDFREKWKGWGGAEFWEDAKKQPDPVLQRFLQYHEKYCPKIFGVGLILSVVFETLLFLYLL